MYRTGQTRSTLGGRLAAHQEAAQKNNQMAWESAAESIRPLQVTMDRQMEDDEEEERRRRFHPAKRREPESKKGGGGIGVGDVIKVASLFT